MSNLHSFVIFPNGERPGLAPVPDMGARLPHVLIDVITEDGKEPTVYVAFRFMSNEIWSPPIEAERVV